MFRWLPCFSLLLSGASLLCASTFTVKVVTFDGDPIPGVRVQSTGPFASGRVLTDVNGTWQTTVPTIGGSACSMFAPTTVTSITKPGYFFDKPSFGVPCGGGDSMVQVIGVGNAPESWTTISAASYTGSISTPMLVSAFGTGLAVGTAGAGSLPLQTTLGDRQVIITTQEGFELACGLLYVAPTQINFIIPTIPNQSLTGQAGAPALIQLRAGGQTIREQAITLRSTAPSLFSANGSGQGVAAASVQRTLTNGTVTEEPVVQFDSAKQAYVPMPIAFTSATSRLVLSLFGTGFVTTLSVTAKVGGVTVPVIYAGPQQGLDGFNRIDLDLPTTLAGKGLTDIVIVDDGVAANTLNVQFQ